MPRLQTSYRRRVKMHDLLSCMNTRVRSPSTLHGNGMLRYSTQGLLKFVLNITMFNLPLPTKKTAAIVFDT